MREREPESFQFAPEEHHVPVWDLGVRFFHWALVLLVTSAVVTIKLSRLDLHVWCGYGVLALLIFRILWGFVGGTHARFAIAREEPPPVRAQRPAVQVVDLHPGGESSARVDGAAVYRWRRAGVAELAYAIDSKSIALAGLRVRVPPPASRPRASCSLWRCGRHKEQRSEGDAQAGWGAVPPEEEPAP